LQVAVFCITLQYTLAFKKTGYAVADSVDEYGEFFLNRRIGALESDLALFVFCVNANGSSAQKSSRSAIT
jgi:hypothetical protein